MEQQLLQEQKKPNLLAFQVAIAFTIYYVILVIAMSAFGINMQSTDVPMHITIISTVLTWGVFIFALFYAQTKHKKELGGFITFGRAFSTGFKTAAYAGLFLSISMLIYFQFIDTGAMEQVMDTAIARAKGDEKQIQAIQMMSKYMGVMTAFSIGMVFAFIGLIISLISGLIIRKDRPYDTGGAQ